ncbi:TPA: Dabb family protein [Yersinia enterocolitica]|uniref:Stress responsive A/B Barrel Domain n=1 Tax=Yersinia enterocolitica TaxID=630 RepID=A0ABM9SJC1_YEREN|nr:Dabb family protein [Yersinia enterocolitica]AOF17049.1 hypothetical protein BB936_21655 [Yersinia enterocolitica]AOF17130.1 hypothetical protein BB936_22175 [Yersinia enterocolitica]AOF17306.1 hypothetical protein BED34_00465 [Yersinia enterocolitica]AOF25418.1 hypothetical protein BED33_22540 [Yersinia enterocolitica]AOF29419.1 hypothetical protein BED32_21655 [Yersinia enterocolitica]
MSFRALTLLILVFIGIKANAAEIFNTLHQKSKDIGNKAFTEHNYNPGIIKHIVIFKYKSSVTTEQRNEVVKRFLQLRDSKRPGNNSPYILEIITGSQNSGEKANMGFEQAFIVTFATEGDRNYYVGTPVVEDPTYYDEQHAEFKKFAGPLLADSNGVLVFDFKEIKN